MPTITKPKSKEDILKSFGITRATRYHDYDYLYESVLKAMDAFAQAQLPTQTNPTPSTH